MPRQVEGTGEQTGVPLFSPPGKGDGAPAAAQVIADTLAIRTEYLRNLQALKLKQADPLERQKLLVDLSEALVRRLNKKTDLEIAENRRKGDEALGMGEAVKGIAGMKGAYVSAQGGVVEELTRQDTKRLELQAETEQSKKLSNKAASYAKAAALDLSRGRDPAEVQAILDRNLQGVAAEARDTLVKPGEFEAWERGTLERTRHIASGDDKVSGLLLESVSKFATPGPLQEPRDRGVGEPDIGQLADEAESLFRQLYPVEQEVRRTYGPGSEAPPPRSPDETPRRGEGEEEPAEPDEPTEEEEEDFPRVSDYDPAGGERRGAARSESRAAPGAKEIATSEAPPTSPSSDTTRSASGGRTTSRTWEDSGVGEHAIVSLMQGINTPADTSQFDREYEYWFGNPFRRSPEEKAQDKADKAIKKADKAIAQSRELNSAKRASVHGGGSRIEHGREILPEKEIAKQKAEAEQLERDLEPEEEQKAPTMEFPEATVTSSAKESKPPAGPTATPPRASTAGARAPAAKRPAPASPPPAASEAGTGPLSNEALAVAKWEELQRLKREEEEERRKEAAAQRPPTGSRGVL